MPKIMGFYQNLLDIAQDNHLTYCEKKSAMIDASLFELRNSVSVGEPKILFFNAISRIDNTWNLVSRKTGNWLSENEFSFFLKNDDHLKQLFN